MPPVTIAIRSWNANSKRTVTLSLPKGRREPVEGSKDRTFFCVFLFSAGNLSCPGCCHYLFDRRTKLKRRKGGTNKTVINIQPQMMTGSSFTTGQYLRSDRWQALFFRSRASGLTVGGERSVLMGKSFNRRFSLHKLAGCFAELLFKFPAEIFTVVKTYHIAYFIDGMLLLL